MKQERILKKKKVVSKFKCKCNLFTHETLRSSYKTSFKSVFVRSDLKPAKTGEPGEKPLGARTRTNNKLNPHMTPGPGVGPGPHWWEASALTTALSQ